MDNQKSPSKRGGWVKAVFALSLALNLLVVGAVAGAAWRHGGPGGPDGRARSGGPPSGLSMLRALERDDRRAVLRAARAAQIEPAFDRGAFQAELVAALRAEPLDMDALDRLLAQQRAYAGARLETVLGVWRAHVQSMSADAREAYAERLEEGGKRRGKDPQPEG